MSALRRTSRPVYQQIADELRDAISGDGIGPDGRLPTEAELVERYGVTRGTVRQALAVLVNEGLVVSDRPRGYFVRRRRHMTYRPQQELLVTDGAPAMDRFHRSVAEEGRTPSQTIDVSIVVPPREIATRLRLNAGETAAVRRRVRSIDGEPFNINDSYYPLSIVQGSEIVLPHDIARGANRVLAELGHRQVGLRHHLISRMPTPSERHRLQLSPGTPVTVHYLTGYTAEGIPVRAVENVLPGDRHEVLIEDGQVPPDNESST
ncbi:GntR family transcriptional regulator [Candidatus Frankia alpina]|uniref:GntR family transcriptional regulator n=1 Tax=Candidatus Frankia alpina TaxID=2699483 RepID=A0A4S5EV41_9ACTN|nr:GntR family transcriptional regulator [Candidatus Frankia alpina]THJ76072.1 GntR family transcriptional regulator [Candidatus Frankia alpina]